LIVERFAGEAVFTAAQQLAAVWCLGVVFSGAVMAKAAAILSTSTINATSWQWIGKQGASTRRGAAFWRRQRANHPRSRRQGIRIAK